MKAGKIIALGLCTILGAAVIAGCGAADTEKKADSSVSSTQNSQSGQSDSTEDSEADSQEKTAQSADASNTDDQKTNDQKKKVQESDPQEDGTEDQKTDSKGEKSDASDSGTSEEGGEMDQYVGAWTIDGALTQENASEDIFAVFGSGLRSEGASLEIKKEDGAYTIKGSVGVGLAFSGKGTLDEDGTTIKFVGKKIVEGEENASFDISVKKVDDTTYLTFEESGIELYFGAD